MHLYPAFSIVKVAKLSAVKGRRVKLCRLLVCNIHKSDCIQCSVNNKAGEIPVFLPAQYRPYILIFINVYN